jgi:hypothetical protein
MCLGADSNALPAIPAVVRRSVSNTVAGQELRLQQRLGLSVRWRPAHAPAQSTHSTQSGFSLVHQLKLFRQIQKVAGFLANWGSGLTRTNHPSLGALAQRGGNGAILCRASSAASSASGNEAARYTGGRSALWVWFVGSPCSFTTKPNRSFNRTCFGVTAPGIISFLPGSATLAHAG